ncbi:MAG TPA: class I SAM-dependent methyltransferase [Gemmatimonadales bacterium]|nr:class I SAM-dependent methyltransferase [Gemmatimonadales bacterium]
MIEHISDTARWVAYYRAMETDRPDALFRDPFARRLAGPVGEAIVDRVHRGRQMAWAMIVRTAVFDEIILDRVRVHGVDLVVNLACGLDTRPWRLPLPPTLRWVDVDLPGILEAKTSALSGERPTCRYEAAPTDLTDPVARDALLSRLASAGRQALVVTEGLLVYLMPEQVADLARALRRAPAFRWWLTDLASPRLLKMLARSWGSTLERGNAPFRFGPAEGTAFFRAAGWREALFRSTLEEARRLHREMPMMWLWRSLGRLSSAKEREAVRRMSGYVLLERDAT